MFIILSILKIVYVGQPFPIKIEAPLTTSNIIHESTSKNINEISDIIKLKTNSQNFNNFLNKLKYSSNVKTTIYNFEMGMGSNKYQRIGHLSVYLVSFNKYSTNSFKIAKIYSKSIINTDFGKLTGTLIQIDSSVSFKGLTGDELNTVYNNLYKSSLSHLNSWINNL